MNPFSEFNPSNPHIEGERSTSCIRAKIVGELKRKESITLLETSSKYFRRATNAFFLEVPLSAFFSPSKFSIMEFLYVFSQLRQALTIDLRQYRTEKGAKYRRV